jgi:hypothetical protein
MQQIARITHAALTPWKPDFFAGAAAFAFVAIIF